MQNPARQSERPALSDDSAPVLDEKWRLTLDELAKEFQKNQPFPHLSLDRFLEDECVREAAAQFPLAGSGEWIQYKHYNERTLGQSRREALPGAVLQIVDQLSTQEFVDWLSTLTGIPDLRPDPDLAGGGMHQTERGGFLNIHSDFQTHPFKRGWRRECNLILYLNESWEDEWGGQIEFWDRSMTRPVVQISPVFNRVVIFHTTPTSFHGYPQPLQCPPNIARKSLALYYYTVQSPAKAAPRPTSYLPRPGDGRRTRFFMRCDNLFLWIYGWIKRTFRLSDRIASWILSRLSK